MMKERGERERAGEEWEEGGLLASRFSWWVPGGGSQGGKQFHSKGQWEV